MRAYGALLLLILSAAAGAEGLASPESALPVADGAYVSNMGAKPAPSVVDGDGYIARLTAEGDLLEARYLPTEGDTLNAPKGLALLGGILYVADIDRVVGFDPESRQQVFELSLAATGTRFLNDLAVVDGELAVSATDIGTVFAIDPARGSYRPLMRFLQTPNGLYYDGGRRWLYVAGYGRDGRSGELGVIRLDTRIPSYRRLGLRGRLDGIARVGEWLVISDWGKGREDGRLHGYHPASGESRRDLLTGLAGPADLAAAETGQVWLPEMLANRLRVETIELP